MNDFLEIKLHRNKPTQRFRCTLLQREPGCAVLLYVADGPGQIADILIAEGSRTIAHYREDLPYVAWRMFDAGEKLIGTLFHVCANVSIQVDRLVYEDLLLDIWVAPDGSLRILDQDELHACAEAGLVNARELDYIRSARLRIVEGCNDIIAGLEAFERDNRSSLFAPAP